MKTSLFFALTVLLCELTERSVGEYIFLNKKKTWNDAQNYCRQYYTDLATITSQEDVQMLTEAAGNKLSDSWIGLHRNDTNLIIWQWSDLELSLFFNWKNLPIDISKKCVQITDKGWEEKECSEKKPFFCYSILKLVKEKKTWEEAYEYCRSNYTSLAFVTSDNDLIFSTLTERVSVWTGLRFMAGEWLWVHGEPLENLVSLPNCPAPPYHCGARNSKTGAWENRDCEEKLVFLCY